ncbi:hypothetical protein E4U59_004967 [Claviceps monticola]|nr:hypothetical protein E4U59_004967 [Claviceps monticola]
MFDPSAPNYREWSVPCQDLITRGSDRDWSRPKQCLLQASHKNTGPRSLIDMAMHVVADNIGDITETHLQAISGRLLWRIWRLLEARGVCLHVWKLFSKTMANAHEDISISLYRFTKHIQRPASALKVYTQPLLSPTLDFLSHLVISGGCQLIQAAGLPGVQFPEVSDRLLRGWSEVDGPFPLLRVLRVRTEGNVTQDSLRWVTKFPSLAIYDVTGDWNDWEDAQAFALQYGWKLCMPATYEDESLRQYMMMLDTIERPQYIDMRNKAARVDAHLKFLCDDPRYSVECVTNLARRLRPLFCAKPPLLDCLTGTTKACMPTWDLDASKIELSSCHTLPFEAWAFWLCSLIGQSCGDEDLRSLGCNIDTQALAGPYVLPSRPMVSLCLGHNGRNVMVWALPSPQQYRCQLYRVQKLVQCVFFCCLPWRNGIGHITQTAAQTPAIGSWSQAITRNETIDTPIYVLRRFYPRRQNIFIRCGIANQKGTLTPVPSRAGTTCTKRARSDASSVSQEPIILRSKKRQRLGDMLQTFY